MRYSGNMGFAVTAESDPGVYEKQIIVKHVTGTFLDNPPSFKQTNNSSANEEISLDCRIRIVANQYIRENLGYIAFAEYGGVRWKVTRIVPSYPSITFTLGGLYNG